MVFSFLATTLMLGAVDVQLETIHGEAITAQVVSLNTKQLTFWDGNNEKSLPTGNLLSIEPRRTGPRTTADVAHYVTCKDETHLPARTFSQIGDMAKIEAFSRSYQLPAKQIHSVRLYRQGSPTDRDWATILAREHVGDVIVIRKNDATLTFLSGIIEGVGEDILTFRYEGDKLEVNKKRLEGWFYYHPAAADLPTPVCVLETINGAHIQVLEMETRAEQLQIVTPAKMVLMQSWATINRIRFATDNLVYLSDLDPIDTDIRPRIGGGQLQSSLIKMMYGPKKDVSLHGEPLSLVLTTGRRAEKFEKGISLHSRTHITYRLPGKFKKLSGWAGIDPAVGSLGNIQLRVVVNDQVLFDCGIEGGQPATLLDVNLQGASRIRIVADFADGSDVGDYLNLCDLKVTK